MTTFGVTSTGFVPKRLADIRESLTARLQEVTDPTTGQALRLADGETSVIQQIRDIFSEELALCWDAAYLESTQFDPLYATGAGLSGLVQLNGITRKRGTGTVIAITITGTAGTAIPQGSIIATADRATQFTTDAGYIIGGGGTITGTATCTTNGAINPTSATITAILSPVAGWTAVTNTSTVTVGTLEETDSELRTRQQVSTSATSYRQIDAIYSAVLGVDGVSYCRAYQNIDTVTDGRGIPPKTIAVVALGGDSKTIANAIFFRAPCDLKYFGDTTETLTDQQGFTYDVKFQRPTSVPIMVEVSISSTDSTFPTDYEAQIKTAIVNFAQYGAGALGATQNFDRNGFPPGENIIVSQLYLPVLSVPGLKINSLLIDTVAGGTPAASDITIAWDEVGTFDPDNITVTLV